MAQVQVEHGIPEDITSLSRQTLEANEAHKNALDTYTNKLQAELLSIDKLIAAVEQLPEDESLEDPGDKWCLHVENAFKPASIIDLTMTLDECSPFYDESVKRVRYIKATAPNPFSTSEKRYLEKAVIKENTRLAAFRAQQSGQDPFKAVADGGDFLLDNVDGIDWASVARDVSASNSPLGSRTAQECKVRWLGSQHSKIASGKWEESEEERLRELVESKRDSKIDWREISQLLGTNRTPLDCIRRYQMGARPTFHWTKAVDKKLIDAVQDHGTNNWTLVAQLVSPEVSANQCQIRYTRSLNPNIKRGKFTAEEDQLLLKAIETHGSDWVMVAQAIPGRTNVQCRDRYIHQLAGGAVKVVWTDEEDAKLKKAVEKLGTQWVKVREEMGSVRERNSYANRYRTLLRKEMQESGQTPARATSVPVFRGGSGNEEPPAVEREGVIDPESVTISRGGASTEEQVAVPMMAQEKRAEQAKSISREGATPTSQPTEASQKPKVPAANDNVKRRRKPKVVESQTGTVDPAHQGESSTTTIAKKRPRPRPTRRGAKASDSLVSAPYDTPSTSGPDLGQKAPKTDSTSKVGKQVETSSTPLERDLQIAAASLAAELSDLTDIEDLQGAPPPKKKARSNPKTSKTVTPIRPRKGKGKAGETVSTPPHSMRTRSSTSNTPRG